MRHEIALAGPCFRLRPVRRDDAALIVELRGDPSRTAFLHAVSPDVADQERYLDAYLEREHDYYFVVERAGTGRAEGLVSVYDVDPARRTGEWGRWVLREGSLAAAESALLAYRVAFEALGLDSVYCRTVADNERVVSFHDSCGLERAGRLPAHFTLAGTPKDAVEHRLHRADWPRVREVLTAHARAVQRVLERAARRGREEAA